MKVLMFGWEFPHHISGGLGTACFGLTESLTKPDTQILFVIPKTDKENKEENLSIISASKIDVPVSSFLKHTIQQISAHRYTGDHGQELETGGFNLLTMETTTTLFLELKNKLKLLRKQKIPFKVFAGFDDFIDRIQTSLLQKSMILFVYSKHLVFNTQISSMRTYRG